MERKGIEQLSLIQPEPFDRPVKRGVIGYVPILKSMPGELGALRQASAETWDRIAPLIEATGRAGQDEPPDSSTFPGLAERLGRSITAAHPFFLDFPWINSGARVNVTSAGRKTAVDVIEYVFNSCRNSGLLFVPVLSASHDAGRPALVRKAMLLDGRGVCLRIRISGVVWENGIDKSVQALLDVTGAEPDMTDLLLDLSYISTPPPFRAQDILSVVHRLPYLDKWRSLILAGTVIPSTAAGWEEGGITEIPRHEWRLYRELRTLRPARLPTFGDYAVQHPEPPASGGPGMRASIRYTTSDLVLFARGHSILEEGSGQYRDLSRLLVARPEFCGAGYSWGDKIIGLTAASSSRPKGEPLWREAGTSHHLQFVADAIGKL